MNFESPEIVRFGIVNCMKIMAQYEVLAKIEIYVWTLQGGSFVWQLFGWAGEQPTADVSWQEVVPRTDA